MIRINFASSLANFLAFLSSSLWILWATWNFKLPGGISIWMYVCLLLRGEICSEPGPKNGLQAAPLAGCGYTNTHQNSFFPFPLPTVTVNSWLYSFFCPHSWKLRSWTRMAKSSMAQSAWRSPSSTRTTTDPCSKRGPTWVMSWRDLPQVSPCHSQLSNSRQILLWWGRYYHIVQIFLLMLWFAGSIVHKKEWEQHSFGKTGNGFWKTSLQFKKKKKELKPRN